MYPQPHESLLGEKVVLRQWRTEDAEWYVMSRDEEVLRWTSEPHDLSVDVAQENIERHLRERAFVSFAMTDAAKGNLLGNIGIAPKTDPPRDEVSYWLAPYARG